MAISIKYPVTKLATASGVAAFALLVAQPAFADENNPEDSAETSELTKGEQRLARMLEGRVAGEPQRCIRSRFADRFTTIDETAYVYGRGNTIYVQRTQHPERIDRSDTLISRRFDATSVCKTDVVTTVDAFTGFFTGAVFFDDFIPYTRVKEEDG